MFSVRGINNTYDECVAAPAILEIPESMIEIVSMIMMEQTPKLARALRFMKSSEYEIVLNQWSSEALKQLKFLIPELMRYCTSYVRSDNTIFDEHRSFYFLQLFWDFLSPPSVVGVILVTHCKATFLAPKYCQDQGLEISECNPPSFRHASVGCGYIDGNDLLILKILPPKLVDNLFPDMDGPESQGGVSSVGSTNNPHLLLPVLEFWALQWQRLPAIPLCLSMSSEHLVGKEILSIDSPPAQDRFGFEQARGSLSQGWEVVGVRGLLRLVQLASSQRRGNMPPELNPDDPMEDDSKGDIRYDSSPCG
ncbi:hypothetical protein TIFTF001_027837 [Ficus carica]|uniref:Uncharacterized protein n=1 Tax=Ficus carica TaxID=3494 RepID=A0AA88DNS3_FICCA|nr:hypothetical protein TIFTF001_027837 [Ficus carica]